MQIRNVMTRHVATTTPDMPLADAVHLMLEHSVSGLPVLDATGRLLGIVTEADLLRRVEIGTERYEPRWIEAFRKPQIAEAYTRSHGRSVADVMTSPVVTTDEDAALVEAVDLMEARQIRRLPVLRDGALVGIVSRADIIRGLAQAMETAPPAPATDGEIRDRIWAELARQQWTLPATAQFLVTGGAVELRGVVPDERYRAALRIAAENTEGVNSVNDYLLVVPPAELEPIDQHRMKYLPPEEGPGLSGTLP
jgi:CBS domain-containing protein